ncbi:MAG: hypothetical protein GY909_15615 [Oligoflexia bacterium]|nr:hypothetical protein [Oligoflexia bacterium]
MNKLFPIGTEEHIREELIEPESMGFRYAYIIEVPSLDIFALSYYDESPDYFSAKSMASIKARFREHWGTGAKWKKITQKCSNCFIYKKIECFYKKGNRYQSRCIECNNEVCQGYNERKKNGEV